MIGKTEDNRTSTKTSKFAFRVDPTSSNKPLPIVARPCFSGQCPNATGI